MKRLIQTTVMAVLMPAGAWAAEWKDLFNGKDFTGWTQRGGAALYTVEDGCVVGTSVRNTPNSFMCTDRDYADFVLEYDFKVDERLNSGVQFRSQEFEKVTEIKHGEQVIKVPAKRVHGYQCEIDPDPKRNRHWSAGVYEEAARGWLYPGLRGGEPEAFTLQGRKVFKSNDWNRVRIEAKGDSIKTFLNGEPRADLVDDRVASGFIGLQVHGIGNSKEIEGAQVRWKNIRIQELGGSQAHNTISAAEQQDGWKLLWDGKTSNGWRSAKSPDFPKAGWIIENGELIITETGGGESSAAGDIITVGKYADFELKAEFKITPGANSGIKFYVDPELNKGEGSSIGIEFQILDDKRHPDALLGKNGNRTIGSLYDLIPAPKDKVVHPPGEWNTAHVISKDNKVEYRLNGVTTVKFERGTDEWRKNVADSKYKVWPGFGELKEGHILLQDHGNRVSFRNIKIREL